MKGHLTLSKKEQERLVKFEDVRAGRMTLTRASQALGLSYRQTLRAYQRFCEEGAARLVHRRRGHASNRRTPAAVKAAILARYRVLDPGFGPTLAAEEPAKEGFRVNHETLRRRLLEKEDWQKSRRRPQPSPRPPILGAAPSSAGPRTRRHDSAHFQSLWGLCPHPPEFTAFRAADEAGKNLQNDVRPGLRPASP